MAQCASPLTLGLVLSVYRAQLSRRVSLAECRVRASYRTTGPCHLLSTPAALTTPRRPQSGCDGLSQFNEDIVPCPRIISCRNLTRHAGRAGDEPMPCRIASQAFTAPRREIARPLSHGGRSRGRSKVEFFWNFLELARELFLEVFGWLPPT